MEPAVTTGPVTVAVVIVVPVTTGVLAAIAVLVVIVGRAQPVGPGVTAAPGAKATMASGGRGTLTEAGLRRDRPVTGLIGLVQDPALARRFEGLAALTVPTVLVVHLVQAWVTRRLATNRGARDLPGVVLTDLAVRALRVRGRIAQPQVARRVIGATRSVRRVATVPPVPATGAPLATGLARTGLVATDLGVTDLAPTGRQVIDRSARRESVRSARRVTVRSARRVTARRVTGLPVTERAGLQAAAPPATAHSAAVAPLVRTLSVARAIGRRVALATATTGVPVLGAMLATAVANGRTAIRWVSVPSALASSSRTSPTRWSPAISTRSLARSSRPSARRTPISSLAT